MSNTIYITKGLPASGKSTWAKQMLKAYPGKVKRICKDDLRAMLDDGKWGKANEKFVLHVRDRLIVAAVEQGFDVIVDDTNLHPKHIEHLCRMAIELGAEAQVIPFTHVPLDECIRRDQKRQNYVGEKVIRRMHQQFLTPAVVAPEYDPNLPDCIICDLDGTLALFGDANPYDRDFSQDQVNGAVAVILGVFYEDRGNPPEIVIFSARNDKYCDETRAWLAKYDIPYRKLVMRQDGDIRKDAVIKREMYEEHVMGKYNVLFVLDDRQQVVDMWRSLGLTCLQVAPGDF